MATLNELAVLIAEPLQRELDTPFKDMVKARVKYWRSKLLRDTLNKSPKDRKFFLQTIYVKLESTKDCNLVPCSDGVMRSVNKIPSPLRANGILFDYVGSAIGSQDGTGFTPFKPVDDWQANYFLTDPYLPKVTKFYSYRNEYLYCNIPIVRIDAIFDDPEVAIIAGCNPDGSSCTLEEVDFGISGDIAQQIVQYILQVDFNTKQVEENKTEVNVDQAK